MATLTLQSFIASVIKQHRRKSLVGPYYYLTPKQTTLYNDLFRAKTCQIYKQEVWTDGKFIMYRDGAQTSFLMRYGKKLSWSKPCQKKSMAFIKMVDGKMEQYWFNCEGGSLLTFN